MSTGALLRKKRADQCFACTQANGYSIDFDDWHAEVHGTLPYSRLLKRDERMREFLLSIPLPKYIFTNADQKHANTCLDLMGVADLFQVIHSKLLVCSIEYHQQYARVLSYAEAASFCQTH